MYLGENNGNLSETKNVFFQHASQPFLKMRKFLLDMRKDFLIMSNFYLVEILSEPNSLTIVTSKNILKMSNYVLILSIFLLITRIGICSVCWVRTFFRNSGRLQKRVLCFVLDGLNFLGIDRKVKMSVFSIKS